MSLTKEERWQAIMLQVNQLTETAYEAEENVELKGDHLSRIILEIKYLWHGLLGNPHLLSVEPDSGGDAEIDETSTSPWAVAITRNLSYEAGTSFQITSPDYRDPLSFLTIEEYLRHKPDLRYIYRIYQYIEYIVYFLRRRDDDFLHSLENLDRRVSTIQGLCFSAFYREKDFAKAILLRKIIHLIYGHCWYYNKEYDVVQTWLDKCNIHRSLAFIADKPKNNLLELIKMHVGLVNKGICPDDFRNNEFCQSGKCLWPRLKAGLQLNALQPYFPSEEGFLIEWIQNSSLKSHLPEVKRLLKIHKENSEKEDFIRLDNPALGIYGFGRFDTRLEDLSEKEEEFSWIKEKQNAPQKPQPTKRKSTKKSSKKEKK